MPPLDNNLSPEEIKFFETGELQPGMAPAPEPAPTPEAQAAAPTPQATAPAPQAPAETPTPNPEVQNEASLILQRALEEAQRKVGQLEANIAQLQQKSVEPQIEEPGDDDPLGQMMHKLNLVTKTVTDLQARLVEQQSQQQELSKFQQFQQQVGQLRDQFTKTHADFNDAYNHVRAARVADLKMFGYSEADIQKALFQEEVQLAQNAVRMGKNPAEVVYDMARRHGYTPKVGNAPATPTTPDAKLQSIQQAQAASKNLPSTPQLEEITLEGLKGASDADLNKLVADDKLWAKITGADQYPL